MCAQFLNLPLFNVAEYSLTVSLLLFFPPPLVHMITHQIHMVHLPFGEPTENGLRFSWPTKTQISKEKKKSQSQERHLVSNPTVGWPEKFDDLLSRLK